MSAICIQRREVVLRGLTGKTGDVTPAAQTALQGALGHAERAEAARDAAIDAMTSKMSRAANGADIAIPRAFRSNIDAVPVVRNVAALASPIEAGVDVVQTLGYATAGDGGTGLWKRVGVMPNHDLKVPAPAGQWWEYADDVIDLDKIGAVGGNPSQDTNALLKALTRGGPIRLGTREYCFQANDALEDGMQLLGVSRTRSRIKWVDATGATSLLRFGAPNANVKVDVDLANLTIDGDWASHIDNTSYFAALDVRGADGSRVTLDRVDFVRGRILDVVVRGPKTAGSRMTFSMTGCRFANGLMGTDHRAAICAQVQENVDVTMIGNEASMPRLPQTLAERGRAGFVVQRAPAAPFLSGGSVIATGNRFWNIGRGRSDTLGCIDVYSGAEKIVISHNVAENVPGRAFSAKGDQSDIIISYNIARNVLFDFATAIAVFQDLFNARANRNAIIVGNIIEGSDADGIFIDGKSTPNAAGGGVEDLSTRFRRVVIEGNLIRDVGRLATSFSDAARGIYVRWVDEFVLVRGNAIEGAVYGILACDIRGAFVCDDNVLRNCGRLLGEFLTGGGVSISALQSTDDMEVSVRRNVLRGTVNRCISLASRVKSYMIDGNDIDGGAVAYYTFGAIGLSAIRRNDVRSVSSGLWNKGGVDTSVQYEDGVGALTLAYATRTLTVPSGTTNGAVTAFTSWHTLGVTGAPGAAQIIRISGVPEGATIRLSLGAAASPITLAEASGGNLHLLGAGGGSFTLDHSSDSLELQCRFGNLYEVARADNG